MNVVYKDKVGRIFPHLLKCPNLTVREAKILHTETFCIKNWRSPKTVDIRIFTGRKIQLLKSH